HARTADRIAAVVSRFPNSAATIVPFDVRSRLELMAARQAAGADKLGKEPAASQAGLVPEPAAATSGNGAGAGHLPRAHGPRGKRPHRDDKVVKAGAGDHPSYDRPSPSPGVNPIGSIHAPGRATVEGRIRA